jgi:hypothetical protein
MFAFGYLQFSSTGAKRRNGDTCASGRSLAQNVWLRITFWERGTSGRRKSRRKQKFFANIQRLLRHYRYGVNDNVDMIGFGGGIGMGSQVGTGWFTKHIESNEGTNDSEATPSFITVAFPKSGSTYPLGLNDKRWISGTYTDSTGVHGFIAKPNF